MEAKGYFSLSRTCFGLQFPLIKSRSALRMRSSSLSVSATTCLRWGLVWFSNIELLAYIRLFQLADRLIGIYKTDNCTKSVTIDPAAIAGLCSPHENSSYTDINMTQSRDYLDLIQFKHLCNNSKGRASGCPLQRPTSERLCDTHRCPLKCHTSLCGVRLLYSDFRALVCI